MEKEMALGKLNLQVEAFTLDTGKMASMKEREDKSLAMVVFTKVIGKITKDMGKGNNIGQMVINMKAN